MPAEGRQSLGAAPPDRDRQLLYAAAFLRALATGMIGVLLGLYLAELGYPPKLIGWIVGAGIAGVATSAAVVTLTGDRLGRRRSLVALALLGGAGALAAALVSHPLAMAGAAFLGMLNGMGRDRGAALVLEQAVLPATASDRDRTRAFAWYNVLQDAGHAFGGLLAVAPTLLTRFAGVDSLTAFRGAVALFAIFTLATSALYLALSPRVEEGRAPRHARVTLETRRVLWKISSLFALDSLGGGFLAASLMALFFHARFGVDAAALGPLFFGARVLNGFSHLGAAWLAQRIGLVNTMVFTHIPSSLLLVTVAFAPSFPVAAALFLLREGLVEMDVPTRQSYVMAVVRPEERTLASGVTHLVRVAAWAVAPTFAGALMTGPGIGTPLIVAAAIKIVYDLLLWISFRRIRPPEEQA